MSKLKTSLLAALGLLILATTISLIRPERALAALGFTPVRDVDNPGRQPFSKQLLISRDNPATFAIPTGKRLIITYVDAWTVDSGNASGIQIDSIVNPEYSQIFVPFTTERNSYVYLSQQVMGFADPGTEATVSVGTEFGVNVNIHGYYINVP